MMNKNIVKPTTEDGKSAKYFIFIFKIMYLIGWPNFWTTKLKLPAIILKYHDRASTVLNILGFFLVGTELVGFYTQKNLTEKQKSNQILFGFSHIFLGSYGFIFTYYQKNIRAMTYSLTVELKKYYNDPELEVEMVKKARLNSFAYLSFVSFAMVSYGVDGLIRAFVDTDGTFVTVITAWPDVNDVSTEAGCFRVFAYIIWCIFMTRVAGTYIMLISTFVCLGYQYKNLQSYFYNLDNIFKNDELTLKEKQEKYEKGLKLGIFMHARTLWCTRQCELSVMCVVSSQIVVNVTVIIVLMSQMLSSDRTFGSVTAIVSTMISMLISTGYIMWNAGDVTVEAEAVSTAMFSSGWQNCHGDSSVRIRRLLVIAMTQAQVPVSIRALGTIALSYQSYVSIVKSSYSVFSVLY